MFGMKDQPKRQCGICLNYRTDTTFPTPVCYEIQQHDGKPVAVTVRLHDKRAAYCRSFNSAGGAVARSEGRTQSM